MNLPDFRFPDLEGKTLVITGVTRGIGRAILPGLLSQGIRIIAVSRGLDRLEAIRGEVGASADSLQLFDCDLADPAQVSASARQIADANPSIDGILHNAAIDPRQWFGDGDEAFWQQVFQVNVFAAVTLTRHLLPTLRRSPQGRIIFTGSIISEVGGACLSAYSASKGALIGLTRSLAHELRGSNVTVNCAILGAIQVEKEPEGIDERVISWQSIPRRITPDDLLGTYCLLLSKWGGAINGQTLTIDGGILHSLATPETQGANLPG